MQIENIFYGYLIIGKRIITIGWTCKMLDIKCELNNTQIIPPIASIINQNLMNNNNNNANNTHNKIEKENINFIIQLNHSLLHNNDNECER